MSTGDQPKGTPPTPQSDSDEPISGADTTEESAVSGDDGAGTDDGADAPSAGGSGDAAADGSDDAPADGSDDAPADESGATPAGGSDDGGTDGSGEGSSEQPDATATDDSASSDSNTDGSGDCAEIPCAAHAVLEAEIKLLLQVPVTITEANGLPHKFTLTSDDGSLSQTLALASDATTGDADATSLMTFKDLAEHHAYTLQCDNGQTTYTVFKNVPYDQLVQQLGAQGAGASPQADSAGDSAGNDNAASATGAS